MESVILRAVHPTYLNTQLPSEVAELLQYRLEEVRHLTAPARGIAFFARGPGTVRVVASFRAGDLLAAETAKNRYLAAAQLTEKLVFSLPEAVVDHLGLRSQPRGPHGIKSTDDSVVWFLPAPEYYEFRAAERAGRPYAGPATGGLAHVYLAKSLLEFPSAGVDPESLERDLGAPRAEVVPRNPRPRRA